MDQNLTSLISNLQKEISYARTVSALYDAIFNVFLSLATEQTDERGVAKDGTLFQAIGELWKAKAISAWFERPLLLAAALHRTVLKKKESGLAQFYATCGGQYSPDEKHAFESEMRNFLMSDRDNYLGYLKQQSLQTNEISRGIAVLSVLAPIWIRSGNNVFLFEIGSSAGLNLIADRYGWDLQINGEPVVLNGGPMLAATISNEHNTNFKSSIQQIPELTSAIASRMGCDLNVPDLNRQDDREMLEAMIWGDDLPRLSRLRQAMLLQKEFRDEVSLIGGDAASSLRQAVESLAPCLKPGDIFCVFNTVVTCYFSEEQYQTLHNAVLSAFAGPLRHQQCLWIEHEPARETENISEEEKPYGSLIRLHTLDAGATLSTKIVAGTEMHPKNLVFLRNF